MAAFIFLCLLTLESMVAAQSSVILKYTGIICLVSKCACVFLKNNVFDFVIDNVFRETLLICSA